MENKRTFNNFKELGLFIKKKRRENGARIENISAKLLIKKTILKNIENGLFNQGDYEKHSYLKGFLKTYMKDLNIINNCNLENLFIKKIMDIKNANVSLDNTSIKKNRYGSLIVLLSLILIGLLLLLWNKSTYQDLFELEKLLN